VILLLQQSVLEKTGELPRVDDLERWLRQGGQPLADVNSEDDNVMHTGLTYPLLDAPKVLDLVRRTLPPR
jgi:hypothetical protein